MPSQTNQAVVLAAGYSTRTFPLTLTTPKPLLPVCGQPLVGHNLSILSAAGVKKIIMIVGYRREQIERFLGADQYGMEIVYVHQKEVTGTGAALKLAQPQLDEKPFLVLMGDDLYHQSAISKLVESTTSTGLAAKVANPARFGVYTVVPGSDNLPTDLTEKPPSGNSQRFVNTGAYFFTPGIWKLLNELAPSTRGEYELTDTIKTLIRKSQFQLLATNEIIGRVWQPVGYPWELLDAFDFLSGSRGLYVHPEAEVAADARLTGRINIERGAHVGAGAILFDCYLGPDAVVGKKANLRSCIVGMGARIGEEVTNNDHAAEGETITTFIAGKTMDSNLTQLGAIIGDYAVVGAEAQLAPGTVLWQMAHVPEGTWAKGLIY